MKFNELGRSMVEMLGVLAIIGVLSVGAISGYSKAMNKYKLNRQTQQISAILDNLYMIAAHIPSTDKSQLTKDMLIKLGIVPDGMYLNKTNNNIYDIFNNKVMALQCDANYCTFQLVFTTHEQCVNMLNIGKGYSDKLFYIQIWTDNQDFSVGRIYGDSNCQYVTMPDYAGCLRTISLNEIYSYCGSPDSYEKNFSYYIHYTFYTKFMN